MIYVDDKFTKGNYVFPSDKVAPDEKKGTWTLQYLQAIYSMFVRGQCFTSNEMFARYNNSRDYGAGRQSIEKYLDLIIGPRDQQGKRKGNFNCSHDIFSPAPKYKRIIRGRFESQRHRCVATAIDAKSGAEKEDLKWEMFFKSKFGKQERKIKENAMIPVENGIEYVPESMEELEMYEKIGGFKSSKELEIEAALDYTDYYSDWNEIQRKLIDDIVDINIAVFRDYIDSSTGKEMYEYMDPAVCCLDNSKETGFKNGRFWGYYKLYDIKTIRMESNIEEEELQKLAIRYGDSFGNNSANFIRGFNTADYVDRNGVRNYDEYKVPVFVGEMKSIDYVYKTRRTDKRGQTKLYDQTDDYGKVLDTPTKKTEVYKIMNVYKGCWIIGTEHVFNDGQQVNIPRPNKKEPCLSVHAYALPGKSIMETIESCLDAIQLQKMKLESAMASAPPNGLKIEFGALNNINLGDGNLKPKELIKIYRQNGDIIYKATTHYGRQNTQGSPIEKIEGGIGNMLEESIRIFEMNFNFIAELSGIDRVSAVSAKPGETTATEVQNSVAATTDALQPIYQALISMKERAAANASSKIQLAIKYNPEAYNAYYPILGTSNVELLKISQDITDAQYGIKIEVLPTDQMKQSLRLAIQNALKPGKDGGGITWSDAATIEMFIERGQVKYAQALLAYREEKRRKDAMELQDKNMKNAETTAINLEKEKQKTLQMEAALKEQRESKNIILKGLMDMEVNKDSSLHSIKENLILQYFAPEQQTQQTAAA